MNWYPMSEEERNSIDEFEEEVRFGEYIPTKIDIVLIGESIPKNYNYNFYKVNTLKSPFIQIIYDWCVFVRYLHPLLFCSLVNILSSIFFLIIMHVTCPIPRVYFSLLSPIYSGTTYQ